MRECRRIRRWPKTSAPCRSGTLRAAWLGPPSGKTWYDSLQLQGTKRFSHGLQAQSSFVWSKATELGTGAETGQFVAGLPVVQDIFNYASNKQLNQLSKPLALVISGSYTTPKTPGDSMAMRAVSQVVRDWQLGWVLRYQSGDLIQTPGSTNQLITQLVRPAAGFGPGSTNLQNYVPGQAQLLVDPNSKSFDPTVQQLLNPKAWSDPAAGQWGVSSPFYNNYRWQRQPVRGDELRAGTSAWARKGSTASRSAPSSRTSSTATSIDPPPSRAVFSPPHRRRPG